MNGPFTIPDWSSDTVVDASDKPVAWARGDDDEAERQNARMICSALNAAFYMQQAAKPKEAA